MSSIPGDFSNDDLKVNKVVPAAAINEVPAEPAHEVVEIDQDKDEENEEQKFDISDSIVSANGILKSLQEDVSEVNNSDAAEFQDAIDIRTPGSEHATTLQAPIDDEEQEEQEQVHKHEEKEFQDERDDGDDLDDRKDLEVREHDEEEQVQPDVQVQDHEPAVTETKEEKIVDDSHVLNNESDDDNKDATVEPVDSKINDLDTPSQASQSSGINHVSEPVVSKFDHNHESQSDELTTVSPTPISPVDNLEDVDLNQEPDVVEPEVAAVAVTVAATGVADAPPLPPRNPNKRSPFSWLKSSSSSSNSSNSSSNSSNSNSSSKENQLSNPPLPPRPTHRESSTNSVTSVANYELILNRADANRDNLQSKNASEKEAHMAGSQKLKEEFETLRNQNVSSGGGGGAESEQDLASIDWQFWTALVADYANVARTHPAELAHAIQNGLPPPLRGTIWQLIASSKSLVLEDVYKSLLSETSVHEKSIRRDLSRTSFAKSVNQDSLFNVIKAYSLWDPEVGYIQGMAFIAVPLILTVSEPEAFSLLVELMKTYKLRELFLPEMPGLHTKLYQFDRIIEDDVPHVHVHLARQGVRSSMYASQWFLTFFAYKFPLQIVLRIFDVVVAEGLEAILRFGVALIRKNADAIVRLEFEELLNFLKNNLFDVYLDPASSNNKQKPTSFILSRNNSHSENAYRVNELVTDAYAVKLLPSTLQKYEAEHVEIHRAELERLEEVENLRTTNGQLTLQIKRLENSLATLNQEHIEVANEMVQGKVELEKLRDENDDFKLENDELKSQVEALPGQVEAKLREEMDDLMKRNLEVMDLNQTLEDQCAALEKELVETKLKFATINEAHESLNRRWTDLKKVI
ncbi:rab-GTPase-TBC domain-containing protein, partial [Lipomyces japonicus]|uniref:rab-GTPase-TBC domain-containing protein n=1 Tax=Lipomyces japonicus TaxID=56871 RepID=UPI0034CD4692